jgi:hypothetical protein
MSSIEPGTIITCPRKRHKIGVTREPLKSGDPLRFSALDFEPGQERIQGERFRCRIDGSVYFQGGSMHTDQGWLPRVPHLDPVPPKKDFSEKRDRKLGKEEEKQAKRLAKFKKDKKDKENQGNNSNQP